MMKLKYFICCGVDVYKNVIVVTIVTIIKTAYPNTSKHSFQPSTRTFKNSTTGSSKIIAITFVWNPLESIGFLFLIISKMTLIPVSRIRSMSKALKIPSKYYLKHNYNLLFNLSSIKTAYRSVDFMPIAEQATTNNTIPPAMPPNINNSNHVVNEKSCLIFIMQYIKSMAGIIVLSIGM